MSQPKIVFGLASAGMGHATRDVPLIQRLSKDYEVHVFCSGKANQWLKQQFKYIHGNHPIKGAKAGGKISLPMILMRAFFELPKSFFYIFRIFFFILKNRPRAIISDFEAHTVYAALLARPFYKIPIVSCDHWTHMRMSVLPFEFTEDEKKDLQRWQKTTVMVCPFADRYLVHGTFQTQLLNSKAEYVATPVRDVFLEARNRQKEDGPVVVSMGHLTSEEFLIEQLSQSSLNFVVYGNPTSKKVKNIDFRNFNEQEYLNALARAPFTIVAANSSAIDSIAVGKPFIYCPTPGQFEQKFCGKMFEHLGVAKMVNELRSAEIDQFVTEVKFRRDRVQSLDLFDNDGLYLKIKKTIEELSFSKTSADSKSVKDQRI